MHHAARSVTLNEFKFSAVIDWLELRINTLPDKNSRTTNGGTLKRILADLGVSYAYPLDKGEGGAATKFLIRIQEPATFSQVQKIVERLRAHRELSEAPTVAGIEIAFDARPKVSTDESALDAMTLRMKHNLLPPSHELRLPREWIARTEDLRNLTSRHHKIAPTGTLYLGDSNVARHSNRDYRDGLLSVRGIERQRKYQAISAYRRLDHEWMLDDVAWRVYRKVTDERFTDEGNREGTTDLPVAQWRARSEVTLTGPILHELKLETLDNLAVFDYAGIAARGLLRFANVTARPFFADSMRQRIFVDALGLDEHSPASVVGAIWYRDSRGRRRDIGPFLSADSDMNRRLAKQLARLTTRFRGEG